MPLPTKQRTWIIDPNNRIPFVSLLGTMSAYLYGLKEFLKANGYTVLGSSNGAAGAMDSVDRWLSATNVTTRGANAVSPQSWIVLQDGSGIKILLAYQGASDDIAKISYSPNSVWVAAGTPTHQPTATDEVVVSSASSLIGNTASGDRLWHGWVDSTSKLCRFAVARAGAVVGRMWGIEEYSSSMVVPASADPASRPVWGFSIDPTALILSSGLTAGVANLIVAAVPYASVGVYLGFEAFPPGVSGPLGYLGTERANLQGATGYLLLPLSIGSNTTGARGKIADLYDQWLGRPSGGAPGQTYGAYDFVALVLNGSAVHYVWPWDGLTPPVLY